MSDRFYYGSAAAKWADVVVRPGESLKDGLRRFATSGGPHKVFAETQEMLSEALQALDELHQQEDVFIHSANITVRVAVPD